MEYFCQNASVQEGINPKGARTVMERWRSRSSEWTRTSKTRQTPKSAVSSSQRSSRVQWSRRPLVNSSHEMLSYIVSRAATGKSREERLRDVMANEHTSMQVARRQCLCSYARRTEGPRTKECVENCWVSFHGKRSAARNSQKYYTESDSWKCVCSGTSRTRHRRGGARRRLRIDHRHGRSTFAGEHAQRKVRHHD